MSAGSRGREHDDGQPPQIRLLAHPREHLEPGLARQLDVEQDQRWERIAATIGELTRAGEIGTASSPSVTTWSGFVTPLFTKARQQQENVRRSRLPPGESCRCALMRAPSSSAPPRIGCPAGTRTRRPPVPHALHTLSDDRQTQSGACVGIEALEALEGMEDPLVEPRLDSQTVVFHPEARPFTPFLRPHANRSG